MVNLIQTANGQVGGRLNTLDLAACGFGGLEQFGDMVGERADCSGFKTQ